MQQTSNSSSGSAPGSAPGSPTPSAASTARAHPDDPINAASYAQSFLHISDFMFTSLLVRPDDDTELYWLMVNF